MQAAKQIKTFETSLWESWQLHIVSIVAPFWGTHFRILTIKKSWSPDLLVDALLGLFAYLRFLPRLRIEGSGNGAVQL